jgi:multiple antibiotic resistance protein
MSASDNAVLMFMTLFALYSPLAALPSYMPIVGRFPPVEQRRLAVGLFVYVVAFVVAAIWVGEVLLDVLGISTAALTATGGIALMFESVPLMLNVHPAAGHGGGVADTTEGDAGDGTWRSVLLLPVTFPLTVGGATFAVLVGFAATTHGIGDRGALTIAGVAYAAVTGITLYASAHAHRRASDRVRDMLDRVAGILLTSIAAMLLASGATRLVVSVLDGLT